MPSGDSGREYVERDDYPDADLSDAVFTFCRVKPRQMRVKMLHVWLLAFQIVGSIVVYLSFVWFDPLLAQGAMICVLAPVAMAAVVIGGMLGANVTTMATYSLICNMVVALVAPMLLSFVGSDHATFLAILSRVGPVLVLPFVCAQLCRKFLPGVAFWVSKHSQISFICGWCRWFCHWPHDRFYHRPGEC